jgi:hypothetical protein
VATDWDTIARVNALEQRVANVRREQTGFDTDALAAAMHRADSVMAPFGERAPAPIAGETALDYRRRLLAKIAPRSPEFKNSRFGSLDAGTLPVIEDRVYTDASAASRNAADATPGILVPFEERDASGRMITKFHGDIAAFLAPYTLNGISGTINRNPGK